MEADSVLKSFESAKEWEWSDIIKWLQKVKELMDRYPNPSSPEKLILAKRLAQCLNPALPHGLHYNTLMIYGTILANRRISGQQANEDVAIYSAGIFPFFQYSSPQNKPVVLTLLEEHYLPVIDQVSFTLPGLVASILPGLQDVGNPEITNQIMHLFKEIQQRDRRAFFGAIWLSILRTPKVRHGALLYLARKMPKPHELTPNDAAVAEYIPHRVQSINALVACLHDEQTLIQRTTLDFLKTHFPFSLTTLTLEEKIVLLEACINLFKKREFSIIRRVSEWANLEQEEQDKTSTNELMKILVPALENKFSIKPTNKEEAITPMKIIEPLLETEQINEILILKSAVTIIAYVERYHDGHEFSDEVLQRCITLFTQMGEKFKGVWHALSMHLHEDFAEAIKLINFTLRSIPIDTNDLNSFIPIITQLMYKIKDLQPENLLDTLSLLNMMLLRTHGDIPTEVLPIEEFFNFFVNMNLEYLDSLKLASRLCISLEKYAANKAGLWLRFVTENIVRNQDMAISMAGFECIADLMKRQEPAYREAQAQIRSTNVVKQIIETLWESMEIEHKSVGLLLSLKKGCPEILVATMAESLITNSNAQKVQSIRRFTFFWKQMSVNYPDSLPEIFSSGQGVFILIDQLENESPLVRHSARQWLVDSIKNFSVVINPLFDILLHKTTARFVGKGEMLFYQKVYDVPRILDALRKLKSLLVVGGENVAQFLRNTNISPQIRKVNDDYHSSLNDSIDLNTYLELILIVSLRFIHGEADERMGPEFAEENESVQAATCELLEIVLRRVNVSQAHFVIIPILQKLCHAIQKTDSVIQLLLLNLLQVILYQTPLVQDRNATVRVLESSEFSEVYLQAIHTKDVYIRSHWINFIIPSLELVVQFIKDPILTHYISSLLHSFFSLIRENTETSLLFSGLTAIIHFTLKLANPQSLAEENPDLFFDQLDFVKNSPPKRTSGIFGSMWKTLTGSATENTPEPSSPFAQVTTMIFKEFDNLLLTCIDKIETFEHQQRLSEIGILPYVYNRKAPHENIRIEQRIMTLLNPIGNQFIDQVIVASIKLWIALVQHPSANSEPALNKLMLILICLDQSLEVLLISVERFLTKALNLPKQAKTKKFDETSKEIPICHFLYSLISFYPIRQSAYDAPTIRGLWHVFIRILKQLEFSPRIDINIWILELIEVFSERINLKEVIGDKKMRKDLQDMTPKIINILSQLTLFRNLAHPFPPTIYEIQFKGGYAPKLVGLMTLDRILFPVVQRVWQPENEDKIVQQIALVVNPLLTSLNSKEPPLVNVIEIMTELIVNILEHAGNYIAKVFRRDIIEIFASNDFFPMMDESRICFKNWAKIANKIIMYCYQDKTQIIAEFLNRVPTGVFVSKQNELMHRRKALKCISFMIYSGETNDFQPASQLLCEKLLEYMRIYEGEMVPMVMFTLRIMMLRLDAPCISEMWPRVWPHVLTELFTIFSNNSVTVELKVEALKLLEILSTLGIEEFHMFQWIFFYDVFEVEETNQPNGFRPLIPALLHPDQGAVLKRDIEEIPSKGEKIARNILITTPEEFEINTDALLKYIPINNVLRTEPDIFSIENVVENDFLKLDK